MLDVPQTEKAMENLAVKVLIKHCGPEGSFCKVNRFTTNLVYKDV